MNKMLKFMGALTLGYGLMSCGDSPVESKDVNVDSKGNLYISIRDVNGTVLTAGDSVKVTLLQIDSKARLADSLGTVEYKSLQVGSYQVLIEKEGYASMVCKTDITLASVDYIPIAADQTLAVDMHKIGATVTGTAMRQDLSGINGAEIVPATDASMRLTLGGGACEFVEGSFTATVDEDGVYSFTDLPELANYTIKPMAITISDELNLANSIAGVTGVSDENVKIPQISYTVNTDPFEVVSTNANSVAIDDSIVVSFSKAVDVSRIRNGDINVSNDVAILTSWSNDNKTLTVKAATGKWNYGSSFTLTYSVFSVNGVSINAVSSNSLPITIYTEGKLGVIKGLKAKNKMDTTINYNSTVVNLTWNRLSNASGYKVYRKTSGDSSFVLAQTLNSINDTNAAMAGNDFSDGKSVRFLVVGFNSVNTSPFVVDSAKNFYDKVKPTQSLLYSSQGTATSVTTPGTSTQDWIFESDAASVTAGSTNLDLSQLATMVIDFSEPMDTTLFSVNDNIEVTVDGTENSSDKLTFTKAWSADGSQLVITPYVVAKKSAADVALRVKVSFADVEDKRGNVISTKSNSVSVLYKHNTPVVVPPVEPEPTPVAE